MHELWTAPEMACTDLAQVCNSDWCRKYLYQHLSGLEIVVKLEVLHAANLELASKHRQNQTLPKHSLWTAESVKRHSASINTCSTCKYS